MKFFLQIASILPQISNGVDLREYSIYTILYCRMVKNKGKSKEIRTGIVIEALPNATFRVELDNGEGLVFAHLSGKMRMYRIKVLVGDSVKMEMDEYDSAKGRIIQRL